MPNQKIVYLHPVPLEVFKLNFDRFIDTSKTEVIQIPQDLLEDERYDAVKDATIIIADFTLRVPITRKMIESAKGLKLIQHLSVGYETTDIDAAAEKGVPVSNTAGQNAPSVAEHAIMLMLSVLKKTLHAHLETSRGNWIQGEMLRTRQVWELSERTLGILGLGTIGREVVKRARAFNPKIIYHNRNRLSSEEEAELGVEYCLFEQLLRRSDVLSIHVPLTEETKGLIGKDQLDMMKQGAIIVNLSRGGVVDEYALAESINEGRLSGAGVDVFAQEPIKPGNPLIGLKNVILTPHLGGCSMESVGRNIDLAGGNIKRVLQGEKPVSVVNGVMSSS